MFNYGNGCRGEFQTHSFPGSLVTGAKKNEMLSAMKGSYFKLIAAKRVYSENQFYESPFSTKGSSMQLSNFEIMSGGGLIHGR